MLIEKHFCTLFYSAIASLLLAEILTNCGTGNLLKAQNKLEKQNTKDD